MKQPVISLSDVQKFYGRQKVLEIPLLELLPDSRVTLRGSNGSGKSTLLRLIAGICLPSKGTVARDLNLLGPRLGYVPQAGGLIDELSVEHNLDQRRRLCGLPEFNDRKEQLLVRAGLVDSRTKRFAELSGGRQRLAAIVAALYVEPTWLLIDEPFAGIDSTRRAEIEQVLEEWTPHTCLLIVTSPESEDLLFAASELISLKNGHVDFS